MDIWKDIWVDNWEDIWEDIWKDIWVDNWEDNWVDIWEDIREDIWVDIRAEQPQTLSLSFRPSRHSLFGPADTLSSAQQTLPREAPNTTFSSVFASGNVWARPRATPTDTSPSGTRPSRRPYSPMIRVTAGGLPARRRAGPGSGRRETQEVRDRLLHELPEADPAAAEEHHAIVK